jgi:site-specific DNA-cytosine methylase
MNKEQQAQDLYRKVRRHQLADFRKRMPDDRQGVEFEINGTNYIAAIRRLTPTECGRLQGVPEWYNWSDISETQQYKQYGNGWQCDTIKHCWQYIPKFDRPLNVWSLFDGMSCASITLKELGIPVGTFVSSEIDKHAIKAEKQNFPNMIQVGSVTDINVPELVEKYGVPDFLCGGSPCQSFSFSGKMKGMSTAQGEEIYTLDRYLELKAQGFEFEGQSYLFWEYMRILTELRKYNPNIYFFLENVEMLDKWERCLSHAIGVRGVHINSALVSAQQRKRIYWSNIRVKDLGITSLFDELNDDPFELPRYQTDIPQPEDRGIVIKDILQETADGKYYLKDDVVAKLIEKTDKGKLKDYILEPQVSIQEALDYMASDKEYSSLSEEERQELATLGYALEKQRLHDNYYGKERTFLD